MNINNIKFDNGEVLPIPDAKGITIVKKSIEVEKLAAAELKLKKIKQLVGEKTLASNQIVEAVKEVVEGVEY